MDHDFKIEHPCGKALNCTRIHAECRTIGAYFISVRHLVLLIEGFHLSEFTRSMLPNTKMKSHHFTSRKLCPQKTTADIGCSTFD